VDIGQRGLGRNTADSWESSAASIGLIPLLCTRKLLQGHYFTRQLSSVTPCRRYSEMRVGGRISGLCSHNRGEMKCAGQLSDKVTTLYTRISKAVTDSCTALMAL